MQNGTFLKYAEIVFANNISLTWLETACGQGTTKSTSASRVPYAEGDK